MSSFVVFLLFVNEQSTLKCANQIYAMLFDNRINFSVRCCSNWKQNSKRENEMLTPSNNSGKKYVRDEKKSERSLYDDEEDRLPPRK